MMTSDDEWTTVQRSTRKKGWRTQNANKIKKSMNIQKALMANDSNAASKERETQMEEVHYSIEECMKAFQMENDGFYTNMLQQFLNIVFPNNTDELYDLFINPSKVNKYPNKTFDLDYEIVCYGIGNFENRNSPSMLQLACILLLQRQLSTLTNVKLYYYEPLMTSVEQIILETKYSNVFIIPQNERGKRTVSKPTLFYMPHCPMRLYNNVLWSNWDFIFSKSEWILFFGNSFHSYFDRIIPKDCTNGMISLLPYCKEIHCYDKKKKKHSWHDRYKNTNEILWNMEKAFNDCLFVYFDTSDIHNNIPERPMEHIGKESEIF